MTTENDKDEPQSDDGVYTTYQWAHERDVNDGLDKTASFRYAHNQLENGIATRYVRYSFELEAGEYELEACMGNIWGNSANPDIHVDGKKINMTSLAIPQGGNKVVTGKLSVDKRKEVEVAACSSDATINMNYIKIKYVKDDTPEQPSDIKEPNVAKVSKVSIKIPNRKQGKIVYMKQGDKTALKTIVKGRGNYDKTVIWKSSKTKVAVISSKGKVTAKKAGKAKITVVSKVDKTRKAAITIKVSKKPVKNKTLKISPMKKTLNRGKDLTIKIKNITKKTTDKITYKSSKKSVATVDAYGKVKAKKKGKATITVKCGKKSAKLKLTIKK